MDTKETLIVMLADESGSMMGMKADAEGGYRAFLESQRKVDGVCQVVLYTFSNTHRKVHGPVDVHDAPDLTLVPRGGTALYDAVASVIAEVMGHLAHLKDTARPDVYLVITTDGEENSSMKVSSDAVKLLITTAEGAGWHIVYLGTAHDAWTSAQRMGITPSGTLGFTDYNVAYASVGDAITRTRSGGAGGQSVSFTDEERARNK